MHRLCLYCRTKIEPEELPCPNRACLENGGSIIVRDRNGNGYHQSKYVGMIEQFWYWQPLSEWHKGGQGKG